MDDENNVVGNVEIVFSSGMDESIEICLVALSVAMFCIVLRLEYLKD